MSRVDPKALRDGFSLIQKGVNSGYAPVSLGRDELSWAINATFRNGYATCRPGILARQFQLTGLPDNTFSTGIFQGAAAFERRKQLVAMIGGHLFSIALDTWQVQDVSTPNSFSASDRYRAWLCEAEDFMVVQDADSAPYIYDGATSRRSDTFGIGGSQEVPVGSAMCYSGGRLVVASSDGTQFVVGNNVGDQSSGTVAYNYKDSLLKFTDNQVIAQGGSFSVPINCGPIGAICPVAQVDTSTGQGPTQVFSVRAIFSLNAPADKTQWATLTTPIQTVSMVQGGGLSDRATVNVNGDIWTRSYDGIRSFIVARRDFSNSWVNAPLSQELVRVLDHDDPFLLSYASAAVFDNRLLMTTQPYRQWGRGIAHRGLVVMDFAPLAYMANKLSPAWEGLWTGMQILQVLTGNFQGHERCFVFALGSLGELQLWELTKTSDQVDADNNGIQDVPIQWQIEPGSFTFPRYPGTETVPAQELVSFDGGRLYVDSINGLVTFATSYHMDQDPCWYDWWSWSVCASIVTCRIGALGSTGCVALPTYQQQYRKPFFLPTPREAADSVTHKRLNVGREAQVKLVITGKCRIKRLECTAHDAQEDVVGQPATTEQCIGVSCDDCQDDFQYSVIS